MEEAAFTEQYPPETREDMTGHLKCKEGGGGGGGGKNIRQTDRQTGRQANRESPTHVYNTPTNKPHVLAMQAWLRCGILRVRIMYVMEWLDTEYNKPSARFILWEFKGAFT